MTHKSLLEQSIADEQNAKLASALLREALRAINSQPKFNYYGETYRHSYDLAAAIDDYFRSIEK